ncbi:MAG TPA: PqqD family protein [Actinomycetota bacterium]|nr:PqqD family protein [Actinomycetota bacterium]
MEERVRIDADAVEWREVEGEIVALDVARSEYISVNPTGATLWLMLVEGTTRADLVERLRREFGLEDEAAERDVDGFLASLSERKLLV